MLYGIQVVPRVSLSEFWILGKILGITHFYSEMSVQGTCQVFLFNVCHDKLGSLNEFINRSFAFLEESFHISKCKRLSDRQSVRQFASSEKYRKTIPRNQRVKKGRQKFAMPAPKTGSIVSGRWRGLLVLHAMWIFGEAPFPISPLHHFLFPFFFFFLAAEKKFRASKHIDWGRSITKKVFSLLLLWVIGHIFSPREPKEHLHIRTVENKRAKKKVT